MGVLWQARARITATGLGYFFSEMCIYSMFPIICYFTMTKVWLVNQQKHFTTPADFFFCRYKSKALTVIIDIVYIICAVPFISAVLVAGGRAAEVATGGAVSSQTFTLICGHYHDGIRHARRRKIHRTGGCCTGLFSFWRCGQLFS